LEEAFGGVLGWNGSLKRYSPTEKVYLEAGRGNSLEKRALRWSCGSKENNKSFIKGNVLAKLNV